MVWNKWSIALLLCAALLSISPFAASAADPLLLFTDITSGPDTGIGDGKGSGAIVTIWGQHLGSTQGASTLTFSDSASTERAAAHIYYWENADPETGDSGPSDLYTYHKMQEIAFSIPDSSTGAGNIKVTVDGVASNTLPFTVREGNLYYISNSGNDENNGSYTAPWNDLSYDDGGAASQCVAGDIIYALDGWTETDTDINAAVEGTIENPISVIAYPGATAMVSQSSALYAIINKDGNVTASTCGKGAEYWNFSKLSVVSDTGGIHTFEGARVVGCAVTDATCAEGYSAGIQGNNRTHGGVKVFGNYIHDFGCSTSKDTHHATYNSNRCGIPQIAPEIAWNVFENNSVASAIHCYDHSPGGDYTGTYKVHHNYIKNQVRNCIDLMGGYWTMAAHFFANVCDNTGNSSDVTTATSALRLADGSKCSVKVFNNTFYGGSDAASMIYVTNSYTWEFRNNVIYTDNNLTLEAVSTDGLVAASNNAWWDTDGVFTTPSWDTDPINTDPGLTITKNVPMPGETSSLNDAGYDTSSVVGNYDILGNPWGVMDVGAISYQAPLPDPPEKLKILQ